MNEDWSEFLLAPTLNHFFFIYNHHDDFHTIQYITLQFSHFLLPSVQYIFPLINFNTNKIENDWIKFEINKTYLENLVIRCWVWYLFQKTKTVRQITEFSSSFTEWITLSSSQTGPDVNVRRDGKKKIAENVWQFNLTDWNRTRRAREREKFQLLGFRVRWCTVTEFLCSHFTCIWLLSTCLIINIYIYYRFSHTYGDIYIWWRVICSANALNTHVCAYVCKCVCSLLYNTFQMKIEWKYR